MAETFPETPAIKRKGKRRPAPDFFPSSPITNTKAGRGGGGGGSGATATGHGPAAAPPRRSRDDSGSRDDGGGDREEYIQVSHGDLDDGVVDSVAEVRSGRLDTLGWVSAAWEPRRVVLRTDGSMSVEPLGMLGAAATAAGGARKRSLSREQPTEHHHHRNPQQQGGSDGANANTASAAAANAAKAAKSLGGLAPNWNDPPSPPQWGSVKLKTMNSKNTIGGGGGGSSARTEGMTTWASDSSNTSSNLRSGTPSRRGGLLAAAMAVAGGGSREQQPVWGIVGTTGGGDVRGAVSRATPDECSAFMVGNVAFVLAPRGPGSGYKTHKRLGAELKGAHVLRRAVERRVLSSVGGGGAGPERVNALAPLSCVVDLHGFRAAAVALPAFKPRPDSKPKRRPRPELLGSVPWAFSSVHVLDGGGKPPTKWGYDDVRKLTSEHLGLSKAEDPHLSIARGVLTGDGKIRESDVEEGKDPSSSPPATVVLFPDLLPAENVLLARRAGSGGAPGNASAGGEPAAVWGSEDVSRAVVIPQDAGSRLRAHATLDLAVAAAAVAAAAAERAAELGDVDRWVRRPSPKRNMTANVGGSGGNGGSGAFGLDDKEEEEEEEEGDGAAAGAGGRANLVLEAVSALLGCGRESVVSAGIGSHGMDLFYSQDADPPPPSSAPSLTGGGLGGSSRHIHGGGGRGGGGATNDRASGLAGRRIVGDAVVVLVGGGVSHGAAGSGDVDGDGTANGDRATNPLRLREELMRQRSQLKGSPVEAAGGGSALITETLLPRLAGRIASDALAGGSRPLEQAEEGNPPLFLFEGGHLCAAMHGAGINLRYLPTLRRSLDWEHEGTRQLIASELLARTAKHVLACRLSHSCAFTGTEEEQQLLRQQPVFSALTSAGTEASTAVGGGRERNQHDSWGGVSIDRQSVATSGGGESRDDGVLSVAGEAALFWEVESRLWLLLGPFGSVGGMELDEEEAGSRMHVCQGLSGLHLLPALTRNLGILLTARALRKMQESGLVNRIKFSHVDHRTGGPAAVGSARFKGLGEEAAAVKRRLRDKCRRRWVATRSSGGGVFAGARNGSGRGLGIGWAGVSGEERAEYAAVAEDVLGPFVDAGGRGEDLAYARREIAEAHMAVAVTDWAEGNTQSAKREAERALRALLEGKLGYIGKDEALLRRDAQARSRRGGGPAAADEGVPVPLGLCVTAAGMLLAACRSGGASGQQGGSSNSGGQTSAGEGLAGKEGEEALLWLWRVLQVHFPGHSSTAHSPSGPRDSPLWGSHPLIPAIACLLVGKTAGDLSGVGAGALLASLRKASGSGRRERGGVVDWMAHQLNTGPFPGNHFDNLGVRITRVACGREHSLAVSDAGRLYAFGPSDGGRLGFPAVVGAGGVSAPRILRAPCLAEEKVVAAAGGQMHSSCVCESGKVFTWGHGSTGALGHGVAEDQPTPRLVEGFGREAAAAARDSAPGSADAQPPNHDDPDYDGPDPDADFLATSVACGAWHTLVLTAAGKVFAFGDGFTGQLGLGDRGGEEESRALRPRVVRIERNSGGGGGSPGDVRVTEVACGSFSSAVVSSEGNLYHWGKPDASSDDDPVTDTRYLMPRRVTSGRGGAAPAYRLVAQGAFLTLGIADGVRTDPRGGGGGDRLRSLRRT
eukprot:g12662.t1